MRTTVGGGPVYHVYGATSLISAVEALYHLLAARSLLRPLPDMIRYAWGKMLHIHDRRLGMFAVEVVSVKMSHSQKNGRSLHTNINLVQEHPRVVIIIVWKERQPLSESDKFVWQPLAREFLIEFTCREKTLASLNGSKRRRITDLLGVRRRFQEPYSMQLTRQKHVGAISPDS